MEKPLTTLSGIGLGYDIVGVVVLAWAIFAADYRDLRNQADSGYGGVSTGLFRAIFLQRRDVRFGLIVVVLGFVLQLLGTGYSLRLPSICAFILWLLLVLATAAYYWWRKRGIEAAANLYLRDPRKDVV